MGGCVWVGVWVLRASGGEGLRAGAIEDDRRECRVGDPRHNHAATRAVSLRNVDLMVGLCDWYGECVYARSKTAHAHTCEGVSMAAAARAARARTVAASLSICSVSEAWVSLCFW